jgi:hypothetical protein
MGRDAKIITVDARLRTGNICDYPAGNSCRSNFFRIIAPLFLFSWFFLVILTTPAYAAGGAHITIIQPQGPSSWLIHEFIDNALLVEMSGEADENTRFLSPGIKSTQSPESVTILAAKQTPLLVFASEQVDELEERITGSEQSIEAIQLDNELKREIMRGLYQVPFWPYLAASEVPVREISLNETFNLPYEQKEKFPVTEFAGVGNYPSWDVTELGADGVKVARGQSQGAGGGIVLDYILNGSLDSLQIPVLPDAGVDVVYILDTLGLTFEGAPTLILNMSQIVGLAKDQSVPPRAMPVSALHIKDDTGCIGRYLVVPSLYLISTPLQWKITEPSSAVEYETATKKWTPEGFLGALFILWVIFGALMVIGNFLYKYSRESWLNILGFGMIFYPLYLLMSLVAGGFWGMGFIIGGVVGSRLISGEGHRIGAFVSILTASFIVAILSGIISS